MLDAECLMLNANFIIGLIILNLAKTIMTTLDKKIIASYSNAFDKLSPGAKIGLIESLTKSLRNDLKMKKREKTSGFSGDSIPEKTKAEKFFATFGALKDDEAAAKVLDNIKSHRKFRKKDLSF